MGHLHSQPHGTVSVDGNKLTIDFSYLPLRRLVDLRRLGAGTSVKKCSDWKQAAQSAVKGLRFYLGKELKPVVTVDDNFIITVKVEGDAEGIYREVVWFFGLQSIQVTKASGIRGLTSA